MILRTKSCQITIIKWIKNYNLLMLAINTQHGSLNWAWHYQAQLWFLAYLHSPSLRKMCPYFPAFALNTERNSPVSLSKMRTRITPNTNTFHAVLFPLTVNTFIRSDFTTSNSYHVTTFTEENMLLRDFCRKYSSFKAR